MLKLNSNTKEILDKGFKVLLIRVFGYVFGFLFTYILANKYGPRIQGVFSIAFLFLSVGAMVSKLGVETALVKWVANTESHSYRRHLYFKAIGLVFLSSIIVSATIYFLAPCISIIFDKPTIEKSIQWAALAIPFLALIDVSGGYFKGLKKTTTFGLYFHLGKFLGPLVVILIFGFSAAYFDEIPILSYVIGLLVVAVIMIVHVLIILKKDNRYEAPLKFSRRQMLWVSYPMMISSAIVMIMGWSDVFILGFYESEETIGIYTTAIKLATILSFGYNAIATIAMPKIAQFYNNSNWYKLVETVNFSSKAMLMTGLPLFGILFLFPEFFLSFFGEDYKSGSDVLRILLVAQMINVLTGPVGPIMQMSGLQRVQQNFIVIALILNVLISVSLIGALGVRGVALGSAVGMIIWNVLGAFYIHRKLNIKTFTNFNFK